MSNTNKVSKVQQRVNDSQRVPLDQINKIEPNVFWTDAKNFYEQSMMAIMKVQGTLQTVLKDFISDNNKLKHITDPVTLTNNINILTRDTVEHMERLNSIYAKHSQYSGGTVTPDEHMLLLQVSSEYTEALEIYQANIVPIVAHILEQVGAAERSMMAEKQADALPPEQDVNVVTDVVIKE